MKTPEHRAQPRAGKKFEAELDMHYLAPGAFTVLPLDMDRIPDPPSAPPPYRLPTTRRHRHQSFAIIGEPTSSSPNSRSSSPSGRVSPFKGRGFNPAGSRHASPSVSPTPPEDSRTKNAPSSRIPKPSGVRKSSTGAVFGERVSHVSFRGLNRQASQSMTSLDERLQKRPPPSPRKRLKGNFKQLSPIQGSSPEPSQSMSSPSRIPTKSSSTPPSRLASPSRSKPPVRSQSKPNISSPTKIPIKKYQHVQSKVNSFHKAKPPISTSEEESESPKKRRTSLNRTNSRPNLLPKTFMGSKHQAYTSDSSDALDNKPKTVSAKTFGAKVNNNLTQKVTTVSKVVNNVSKNTTTSSSASKTKPTTSNINQINKNDNTKVQPAGNVQKTFAESTNTDKDSNYKKTSIKGNNNNNSENSEEAVPLAMDVVSSTTTTVVKPLKIDTPKLDRAKPISPLIDGRVLSATSVSQAINKMNDTVLNTQTLIKDSGLSRLNPSITPTSQYDNNEPTKQEQSKKVDESQVKSQDPSKNDPAPSSEEVKTAKNNVNNNNVKNHVNHTSNNHHVATVGLGNAKAIEKEVQNNMNKLLGSMDSSPVSKKSANDRIREARTVIAADVKPIRITVREKPSEVDVQSGNVGTHFSVANGISERPSLPPSQQHSPPTEEPAKDVPPNRCKRFLDSCSKALSCNNCQKCKRVPKVEEIREEIQQEVSKSGCFKFLAKKKEDTRADQVTINIQDDNEVKKLNLWQKLNCCKKNKVGDSQTSCLPLGKRKASWVDQRATTGSFLESEQKTKCCSKQGCNNFFRTLFCCCCKKKEQPPPVTARKESMISSKKKSLTPTSVPPPPEDTTPKIDASLVEHTSQMKGAIPVLPVWLAWFCCFMNCIGPGTGTVLSGLFCLCIGKPRFSQKDGPKPRIGAFIINLIIGFSQFFTVLFCLVGWGWSIWWGVIMVKIAKKHRKFRHLEKLEENAAKPQPLAGSLQRHTERGRT